MFLSFAAAGCLSIAVRDFRRFRILTCSFAISVDCNFPTISDHCVVMKGMMTSKWTGILYGSDAFHLFAVFLILPFSRNIVSHSSRDQRYQLGDCINLRCYSVCHEQ